MVLLDPIACFNAWTAWNNGFSFSLSLLSIRSSMASIVWRCLSTSFSRAWMRCSCWSLRYSTFRRRALSSESGSSSKPIAESFPLPFQEDGGRAFAEGSLFTVSLYTN